MHDVSKLTLSEFSDANDSFLNMITQITYTYFSILVVFNPLVVLSELSARGLGIREEYLMEAKYLAFLKRRDMVLDCLKVRLDCLRTVLARKEESIFISNYNINHEITCS